MPPVAAAAAAAAGAGVGEGRARGWGRAWGGRERAREEMRAPLAHPRIAARRGSPRPADSRALGHLPAPAGGRRAPHAPRRAARGPGSRCHLTPPPPPPRQRAWIPTHTLPGEDGFCSRWAVDCQEVDGIISQNGTEKLRVASFLPICTVQKKTTHEQHVRLPVCRMGVLTEKKS